MSARAYLVRNAATRQLVGLFCARGSNDLFCLLDERADPFVCEYLELTPGDGLFFGDATTQANDALVARRRDARWHSLALGGFAAGFAPAASDGAARRPLLAG